MGSKTKAKPKPADTPADADSADGRTARGPSAHEAPPGGVPAQVDGVVPLKSVRPSPLNPRKSFPQAGIDALADSFAKHGITSRLLVRPVGEPGKVPFLDRGEWVGLDHFELIDGERRFRAATKLDLPEVPVSVRWADDATALELMLVANDQREDVPPSEQAAGYAALVGMGRTLEQISAATGQPRGFVRAALAIAKLPPWALAAVDAGALSRSAAEHVARVPGEESRKRAAACVLLGLDDPKKLDDVWNDDEDWEEAAANSTNHTKALSQRETKELIRTHFQRQLKGAPFSLKVLYTPAGAEPGGEAALPACDLCPKRAGNDAEAQAEGVRQDVCLDPECFGVKVEAYREVERQKFRKRFKLDADADVNPDGAAVDGERPARGWCDWNGTFGGSELSADVPPKLHALKVSDTLFDLPEGVRIVGCRAHLAFDAKDRPRVLVKAKEVLAALRKGGVAKKPEPRAKPKPQVDEEWMRRAEEASPRPGGPVGATAKPADPPLAREVDVFDRAADIGSRVLGEMAAGDCGDIDAAAVAIRMVATFLVRDHIEFGEERRDCAYRALGLDPEATRSTKAARDRVADLTPADALGLCVRLAAFVPLIGEGGSKGTFAADLLAWGELDWDHLRDQARRELAGGETADAKIDRAEAAMAASAAIEPEPPAGPVHVKDLGLPDWLWRRLETAGLADTDRLAEHQSTHGGTLSDSLAELPGINRKAANQVQEACVAAAEAKGGAK